MDAAVPVDAKNARPPAKRTNTVPKPSTAEAEAAVRSLLSEETLRQKMMSKAVTEWTEAVRAAAERIDAAKKAN